MDTGSTANVRIHFFAKARELSGVYEAYIDLPTTLTYNSLSERLSQKFNLTVLNNVFILALNAEFIDRDSTVTLKNGDEIAIIPPISGG